MSNRTEIITLAAGEEKVLPLPGDRFYVVTSPFQVKIHPDGLTYVSYRQGSGNTFQKKFEKLFFTNPATVQTTITILVGFSDFVNNVKQSETPPTKLTTDNQNVPSAGSGTLVVPGTLVINGVTYRRKSFYVKLHTPANDTVRLCGSDSAFGLAQVAGHAATGPLLGQQADADANGQKQTEKFYETDDTIFLVWFAGAATIPVYIEQVWYVSQ